MRLDNLCITNLAGDVVLRPCAFVLRFCLFESLAGDLSAHVRLPPECHGISV